jgi:uncharacterized protein
MRSSDRRILTAFASRLRRELPGCDVWAFGSRARGEASPESDFDICVVADELGYEERELIRRVAWEIGYAHDVVIATVKYTRLAFRHSPGSASPLVSAILREGVSA